MKDQQQIKSTLRDLEVIVMLSFFCLLLWMYFREDFFIYISLAFLFLGVFFKKGASIIAGGWLKFAGWLGYLNTRIILFIIFYLFLTPIALLHMVSKGDFLKIKEDKADKSIWKERNHIYQPKDLMKQW